MSVWRRWSEEPVVAIILGVVFVAGAAMLIGGLGLGGCGAPAEDAAPTFVPPASRQPTPVSGATGVVSRGSLVEQVETRGRVAARREEKLVFPLEGRLEAVHVSAGTQVAEGELLAELHAPDVEQEVEEATFALEQARTALRMEVLARQKGQVAAEGDDVLAAQIELQKAQAQLDSASEEYKKALDRPWEKEEVIDAYEWTLQLAEWNHQLAEARLAEAQRAEEQQSLDVSIQQLQVQQAQERVAQAEARQIAATEQLSDTQLLAPFAGIVVSIDKGVGDQVGSYEPIGVLADPGELQVVAMVLEEDAARIARGRPATIQLDPYQGRTFSGTVVEIGDQPVVWQGRAAYEVAIRFDEGQDVPATIDVGASVTIMGRSREDVLVVPDRAVITIGGQAYVQAVRQDGEVERVEVETGLTNGGQTEVTAGLEEGQRIRMP
jgi:RND family efflux transporter MFP subunit